jgi:hypothetical protein
MTLPWPKSTLSAEHVSMAPPGERRIVLDNVSSS